MKRRQFFKRSLCFFVLFLFLSLSFSLQKACFWRIICSFALIDRSNVFQCTTLTLTSPWIAIIPPHNSYRIVSRIFALHCPLSCLCNSGDTCCIGNKNSLSLSLSLSFIQKIFIQYSTEHSIKLFLQNMVLEPSWGPCMGQGPLKGAVIGPTDDPWMILDEFKPFCNNRFRCRQI